MYEQYFGLNAKPFNLVPDPDYLYLSKSHRKAVTYLDYGIREEIGFILLTGEIGSGKTTLLRNLIKNLPAKVTLSKVFNTRVSSEQLIAMINEDFGLPVFGKDKMTLLRELNEFLIEQFACGNHSILIIDEAQNLNLKLLEEVRLLSNLETDKKKLLQIILVGQPELRKTLSRPELAQLKQRIGVSCHIKPLDAEEMEDYISHRLERAGNRNAAKFLPGTLAVIHRFSRGIPRLINIICDFLMLAAFAENTHELDLELVEGVVGELEEENRYWQEAEDQTTVQATDQISSRVDRLEQIMVRNEQMIERFSEVVVRLAEDTKAHQAKPQVGQQALLDGIHTKLSTIRSTLGMMDERLSTLEKQDMQIVKPKQWGA